MKNLRDWLKRHKDRLKALIEEYGTIAVVVYLAVSATSIAAFFVAIKAGVDFGGEDTETTTLLATAVAAWAAAKIVVPLRIIVTVALTPLVARLMRRRRAANAEEQAPTTAAVGNEQ